jgi:phospholipid/cholesterol/gamma-HCH transport system permease protein
LLDLLKGPVKAFQDFILMSGLAIRNAFRSPHYGDDILIQMDVIGFGSLTIVMLIGLFSGLIMGQQMGRALRTYGVIGQIGYVVSVALIRELGPVLVALLVAGRNASGIASELGSMKVTEQIDAMRALGTDPMKKLVTPRVAATVFMLFFLTTISDLLGLFGGALISTLLFQMDWHQYWSSSWQSLVFQDVFMGLLKPVLFGFVIATIGCYYGMNARGGTQGVGKATTQAVVASSVLILIVDLLVTKLLMTIFAYQ